MTAFKSIDDFKNAINQLNQTIFLKLENNDLDDISVCLEERWHLLTTLIETAEKNNELREYLVELLNFDQTMIKNISEQQGDIKNTLLNMNKLDSYF